MYKIEYNDKDANKFFDTYKGSIIRTINEQRNNPIIHTFKKRKEQKEQKIILWEGTNSYVKDFLDKYILKKTIYENWLLENQMNY
jgi:2-hydroxy-3-keto-5-methylthiopentenyl-1-phosphate phosphatase